MMDATLPRRAGGRHSRLTWPACGAPLIGRSPGRAGRDRGGQLGPAMPGRGDLLAVPRRSGVTAARRDDGPACCLPASRPGQALVSSPGLACPGTSRMLGPARRRRRLAVSFPAPGRAPGSGGGAVADVIGGAGGCGRLPGLLGSVRGKGDLHGVAGAGGPVQRDAGRPRPPRCGPWSPSGRSGAEAAPPRTVVAAP